MTPGRRASEPSSDAPRAATLFALLREYGPWVIPALTFAAAQYNAPRHIADIEHEQAVDRVRDSLSIADRTAFAEALSTLGRIQCRTLGADKITDFGVPCRLLLDGGRWPLMHLAPRAVASSTAMRPVPPIPSRAAALAVVTLLVPAAPSRP